MRRAAVTLVALLSCACAPRAQTARGHGAPSRPVASNVTRADYAGSAACTPCHRDIADKLKRSPMHRMTRDAAHTDISAPFDGGVFEFMGDSVRFEKRGGARFMRLTTRRDGESLWQVTKVIGGRYREDFVGKKVPDGVEERILPVSFLRFAQEWRYKGYSVMSPERDALRVGSRWRTTCIFCHNTVPTLESSYDELYGEGSPKYQGAASVELPSDRRPRFVVTDDGALERAVQAELLPLGVRQVGGSPKEVLRTAITFTRRRYTAKHLVELGIGCEACHGGARAHAENPTAVRPTLAFQSNFARVESPSGKPPSHAEDVNRTCRKCHTVLFTRYPYTWEGRRRHSNPGGSFINSGEARDLALGGCAAELTCTACHDPHGEDSRQELEALRGPKGQALCTSCHEKYRTPAAVAKHSHHRVGSPGSSCVECHMPRKNMALDYRLSAYHRIGSPTDPERLYGDRPMECALCHADKSVESLAKTLSRWYGKKIDRPRLRALYGPDLRQSPIRATLQRGLPHERAVAIGVVAREHDTTALPLLVAQLDNRFPLIRFFARDAIERVAGVPLPVNPHLPGAELRAQAEAWLTKRSHTAASEGQAP